MICLKWRDFGMSNIIEYKGYYGNIEFSEKDKIFYGKVQGIKSLISYEGENADELINDFHTAIDDYLEMCNQNGKEPEKAYKGTFNIRISPELHKNAAIYASEHKMSLNSVVETALAGYMAKV